VLAVRLVDRVGKGIRSSPRDALLAAAVPAAQRGRAFGFHRAADHLGAVLGPLVAFALLRGAGVDVRTVFALAAVPAALAMAALVFGVREAPGRAAAAAAAPRAPRAGALGGARPGPPARRPARRRDGVHPRQLG
jgi:MFS family permease